MAVTQADIDNQRANEAAWQQRRLNAPYNAHLREATLKMMAQQTEAAAKKAAADAAKVTEAQKREARRRLRKPIAIKHFEGCDPINVHTIPPTKEMWNDIFAFGCAQANDAVFGLEPIELWGEDDRNIRLLLITNKIYPNAEAYCAARTILTDAGLWVGKAVPVTATGTDATPEVKPEPVAPAPVNPHPYSDHKDSAYVRWEHDQLKDGVKTEQLPIFREGALIAMKQLNITTLEEPDVAKLQNAVDRLLPMKYTADQVAAVALSLFGNGQKRFDPTGDDARSSAEMKAKYGFQNSSTQYRRA